MRDTFRLHDADSSGNLSAIELGNALQDLGCKVDSTCIKELLKAVDKDGNSTLSFDEFQAIFDVASLKNVFDEIDVDGSGTIKAFELSLAIEKVTGRKSLSKALLIYSK